MCFCVGCWCFVLCRLCVLPGTGDFAWLGWKVPV